MPTTTDTGKSFESLLDMLFKSMGQHGIARIERTSPPVKVLRKTKEGFLVVFKKNPWLDYAGNFSDGTSVVLEAKSGKGKTLKINTKASQGCGSFGGVSDKQMGNLWRWWRGGALVGVLFERRGDLRLYGSLQLSANTKSLHWDDGDSIEAQSFHNTLGPLLRANHIDPK